MAIRTMLLTIGAERHYKRTMVYYTMRGRLRVKVHARPVFGHPRNGCIWHRGARGLDYRRVIQSIRLANAKRGIYGSD